MTIGPQQSGDRDLDRARVFLQTAAEVAGLPAFVPHVQARLEQGERDYAGRWRERPLIDFLNEACEEGADVAGWLALAEQVVETVDMPPAVRQALQVGLHEIAVDGARVHRRAVRLAHFMQVARVDKLRITEPPAERSQEAA